MGRLPLLNFNRVLTPLFIMSNNQPQPAEQQPEQHDEIPTSNYQDERDDYRDEREGYEYQGAYWPTYDQQPGRYR